LEIRIPSHFIGTVSGAAGCRADPADRDTIDAHPFDIPGSYRSGSTQHLRGVCHPENWFVVDVPAAHAVGKDYIGFPGSRARGDAGGDLHSVGLGLCRICCPRTGVELNSAAPARRSAARPNLPIAETLSQDLSHAIHATEKGSFDPDPFCSSLFLVCWLYSLVWVTCSSCHWQASVGLQVPFVLRWRITSPPGRRHGLSSSGSWLRGTIIRRRCAP
jgi:hypothetical protein